MAPLVLLALLLLLFPTSLWAQQLPQESPPLQPPTRVLWVEVVPDVPLIPQDASTQIDVLYVITSSYTTSQTTADTLCAQMITRGNEVLANDPAETSRLHLVGCKIITWTSVTDTGDLSAITNPATGALYPQVNTWRNQFGADLVQMIGTFTNSCGQGYQCTPNFGAQWAYSVVQGSCAVGNYSAIHEMGHNVCLAHDINNQTPTFTYGSGFCDPAGRRDPMSYQTSALSPNACTGSRVSYFGNPNISPFGAPFGTTLNYDNARVWRNEAAAVAAFRAPVVPPTCPTITLAPATLPNGYTGRAYSQLWTATGGTGPYSFAVTVGTVPAGLTFTTATLSGTPTTAGASTFTVRATDTLACTGTTGYTLTILQLPSAPTNLTAFTPAPPSTYGPQSSITCPVGSVNISTAASIQAAITANVGATTFCLAAGVHPVSAAIVPKTGNTFVGAYGAIVDCAAIPPTDNNLGCFRAHNQDIDTVTLRNFTVKNSPMKGVHAFGGADNWVLDYMDLSFNRYGFAFGSNTGGTVTHSAIHNNQGNVTSPVTADRGGGYSYFRSLGLVMSFNDITQNGPEQKIVQSTGMTVQSNFFHGNYASGLWGDGENTNADIYGNLVEDHPAEGIFWEVSGSAHIHDNTIRRSGTNGVGSGIFISTSRDVELDGNILEANRRGIQFYVDCSRVGQGGVISTVFDLTDDNAHDNTVTTGTTTGNLSNLLGYSNCTAAQLLPYTNGSKNLIFQGNDYFVPNVSGQYWYWGGILKTWTQWQALPQDSTGSVALEP